MVSIISGGNQNTRRKPLIYRKSLTNFIQTRNFSSDCIGSYKSNYPLEDVKLGPKICEKKEVETVMVNYFTTKNMAPL